METAGSFETVVAIYQTTQSHNPHGSNLRWVSVNSDEISGP
jgi:hypothetical protein